MSRKQAKHLLATDFMGIAKRIKKFKKSKAVTTANKTYK